MTVASRRQYSVPPGGVVSISAPEIEMTLFGLGSSPLAPRVDLDVPDALHGVRQSLSTMMPRTRRLWLYIVARTS
jgi:hypothetical protein